MGIAIRLATLMQLHREETYYAHNPTPDLVIRAESARRTLVSNPRPESRLDAHDQYSGCSIARTASTLVLAPRSPSPHPTSPPSCLATKLTLLLAGNPSLVPPSLTHHRPSGTHPLYVTLTAPSLHPSCKYTTCGVLLPGALPTMLAARALGIPKASFPR